MFLLFLSVAKATIMASTMLKLLKRHQFKLVKILLRTYQTYFPESCYCTLLIKSSGILHTYTYIYLFHSVLHCSFLLLCLELPRYPASKFPQPCRRNATESALEKCTRDKINPAMDIFIECFTFLNSLFFCFFL